MQRMLRVTMLLGALLAALLVVSACAPPPPPAAAPPAPAADAGAAASEGGEAAAPAAGGNVLNVLCTPQVEWCEGMKAEFEKANPDLTVNFVRMSSGEALARHPQRERQPPV